MTFALSRPVRRLLALTILVLLLVGGWSLAIWPLLDLSLERAADIATLRDQLSRFQEMEARGPVLKQREQGLNARMAAEASYWTGPGTAAIAASMQNVVRQAATASGGIFRSSSEMGERTEGGLRTISVRFTLEAPVGGLKKILEAIETARPSLFIDRLTVNATAWQASRDKEPFLTIDIVVLGYLGEAPA